MLEAKIEDDVVRWAKKSGWIILKLNNPWSKGWPDRLFISPEGDHVYIEFKKPGGRVRKLQKVRAAHLIRNGCQVYLCDNVDSAIQVLRRTCLALDT